MIKCPKCGYEMEAENLPCCVDCHVAELDRQEEASATLAIRMAEGDDCAVSEADQEEFDSFYS